MSNQSRAELITATADAAADFGAAADAVDEAAAAWLGVNRTDLRIVGLVAKAGAMTAGALAEAAGLSPAATTAAIQRLAAAGHLERGVDPADRRRAVVTVTARTAADLEQAYGPIAAAGQRMLAAWSTAALEVIGAFLAAGRSFQLDQADRIRALGVRRS